MKPIQLLFLFICSAQLGYVDANNSLFPEKMPGDFKIEYFRDGGIPYQKRHVILSLTECMDEGLEKDVPYKYV